MLPDDKIQIKSGTDTSFLRKLIDTGEYLKAFDLGTTLLSEPCADRLEIIKLHALCHSKLGMLEDAIEILDEANASSSGNDSETYALLGSFHKRAWLDLKRLDPRVAEDSLIRSFSSYERARELGGGYWCTINAATLAKALGRDELADRLAEEVIDECWDEYNRHGTSSSFWVPASLGEANLVIGKYKAACRWYRAARSHLGTRLGWIASTRNNAELLLDLLSPDEGTGKLVLESIPRLRVALFSGHRLDHPGRSCPRFPRDASTRVKQKLRKELIHLRLDLGVASAADGADILFHECLQGMGKRTIVILPSPIDHFRDRIAETAGDEWIERFDGVVTNADHVEVSSASRFEGDAEDIYSLCTDFMIGSAIDIAEGFNAELVPVVVWDGKTPRRSGGTAYAVSRLRNLGYQLNEIPLHSSGRSSCTERSEEDTDSCSYEELGIFEPRSRPLVVLTTGMAEDSEEKNASRLSTLTLAVMEICETDSINVLSSGFLPGEIYLILKSVEDLEDFLGAVREALPRETYHSMVLHMGLVIRVESSLSGMRNQYCRELDEAIALAKSLRLPSAVCTMQVKALLSKELESVHRFDYRGRFEPRIGNRLRVYSLI